MGDIINLLQNVAFPIAACCAMGWYVVRQDDKHTVETDALRTALENNTIAVTKLMERLDDGYGE